MSTTRNNPTKAASSSPSKRAAKGTRGKRVNAAKTTGGAASKAAAKPRTATLSAPALFDQAELASSQFTGSLFMANGQASLNGTLLLLDGVDGFANAVAAAFGALQNKGFQNGQSVVITGRSAVVHLSVHPITVIVMTGAQAAP